MQLGTTIFLGLALSADAGAVSLSSGLMIPNLKLKKALKIALFFGLFQAGMLITGWAVGLSFRAFISAVSHWIAFALLACLGTKMIYEALKEEETEQFNPLDNATLTGLAVATSIDALAAGVSLSLLKESILLAGSLIGIITFAISLMAVFLGHKFGHLWEDKMEILGGLALIAIGCKILLENI